MPSPLGHSIAGLVVHVATAPPDRLRDLRRAALLVVCANAADLDLAFRLFDGRNHHQAETHGIGAAALAGLVLAAGARLRGQADALRLGLAASLAWLTHIGLDLLGNDTHPPIGLMALWPFDSRFWKSPLIVFYDVSRSPTWEMVRHNAVAGSWELLMLLPVLALAVRLRRPA
jgi:membrane-bound metal-dependent hydrolase YbcI (DUF457 family)